MAERHVNCIGFVFFKQGLTDAEKYIPLLSLNDFLLTHKQVFHVAEAQVVVVTRPRSEHEFHLGPTVCHSGLLINGGKFVLHRRKYGEDIRRDTYDDALQQYLNQPEMFSIMYLRLKK